MHTPPLPTLILFLITFSLLSGCSQLLPSSQQVSEQATIKELPNLKATENPPHLLWQKKLYPQSRGYIEIYPKIANNHVFVTGLDSVSAYDKKTGHLIWQEVLGQTITGGLNIDANAIYVGTEDGSAVALDQKTGKTLWITLLNQPVVAISSVKDQKIVFRTLNGKIHALSTENGEQLWQHTQTTPTLSLQGSSTPIIAGPFVVTGFDNGSVVAYELATGKEAWLVKLGVESGLTELSKLTDIDAEMKAIGTALFAVSYQGSIAGIDMREGRIGWKRKISSFTGIDANEKGLFVSDNQGQIWRLDPLTGNPAWKNDDLVNRMPTAPVLKGSELVIADNTGYIHWYNTQTGKVTQRIKGDDSGYAVAPLIDANTVYAFSKSGLLSVYSTHAEAQEESK
jgi:outer membrane protein assembly factor BamB